MIWEGLQEEDAGDYKSATRVDRDELMRLEQECGSTPEQDDVFGQKVRLVSPFASGGGAY